MTCWPGASDMFSIVIPAHNEEAVIAHCLGALMDDLDKKGMIRGDWHNMIEVANDFEEL